MNTRQYYYLSTIANYGNLSHAAQALHVSPSALSKFLAECERTFGFALFLRYNRRLYPTAVGRYVVECAQKILDEQNRMLLTMKEVTGGNRKAIRLATAPNRGAIIFSRIYNQFSRRYPDISLSLTELYAAEQPGAIARGLVDLALGAGATSSEITDIPIAHEELLVSLPASHPLAKQETIHLADLRDTPFVLQGPRHSIRLIAEQLFQQAGFQPVVAFESNDVILLDSMMHQAVGVGLVSNAHVFPCSELAYRPLNPPVHQTLHLRFPLGHTLTEPERYLAGLLITERLRDPRYKPTDDPLVDQLLQEVLSPSQLADTGSLPREAVGTALQTMQEVNLDSRVMEYLISIVEEQSLSRAAERHFLAQSALSRHLRAVEEMVRTPLFTREHNRLRPTSAGTIFVNNARNKVYLQRLRKIFFQSCALIRTVPFLGKERVSLTHFSIIPLSLISSLFCRILFPRISVTGIVLITIAVSLVCKVFAVDEVRLSQAPAFPFNKSGVFQLTKELRCLVIGTAKRIHNLLYGKNDIPSPLSV